MYWHPRDAAIDNAAIEYATPNRVFSELCAELAGEIGEHNLRASGFDTRVELAEDVAIRVAYSGVDDDTTHLDTTAPNTLNVNADGQWHVIRSIDIDDSPGGMVHVVVSLATDIVAGTVAGALFAIRIDGVVLQETLTGSSEFDQDAQQPAYSGTQGDSTPAVKWGHAGVVLDAIWPIEPGFHTIEVVALRQPNNGPSSAADLFYVKSRELIVLDIVG